MKLSEKLKTDAVSGRLFVFFGRRGGDPMLGPNWFGPEPFFGKDVVDVKPGDVITINQDVPGYPGTFDDIESGNWKVQAVLDHDFQFADHKNGPGNFYSDAVGVEFREGEDNGKIELELVSTIPATKIEDSDKFKLVESKSKLLSDFHGREVIERAGVVLPASYAANPDKRYPVYYEVSGFGGTLKRMKMAAGRRTRPVGEGETEFIHVHLTCLLYTSPSPRDQRGSRMPSSA